MDRQRHRHEPRRRHHHASERDRHGQVRAEQYILTVNPVHLGVGTGNCHLVAPEDDLYGDVVTLNATLTARLEFHRLERRRHVNQPLDPADDHR